MNYLINDERILPLKKDFEPGELVDVAEALRRTTDLMRVHFHLARSGITPEADMLPSENTLEAASRLLSWLAAKLAGNPDGDMPAMPDVAAIAALGKYLENLRWS